MRTVGIHQRLILAFGLLCGLAATATPAAARLAYGITPANELVTFDTDAPGTIIATVAVQGMAPDEELIGIDIRPLTGQLYGMAHSPAGYRLHRIDPVTGQVTPMTQTPIAGQFNVSGDIDFDATSDRLRVAHLGGGNFRVSADEGDLVAIDADLNPPGSIIGIAYTDNYNGALERTLYAIDAADDRLYRIGGLDGTPSPNSGTLTDVGPLGVDASLIGSFDIVSVGSLDTGYAALQVAGASSLYKINLSTGAATLVGQIGNGGPITCLTATSPISIPLYGITSENALVTFNSATPSTILSSVGVHGLQVGETILGLDVRPSTDRLYALGSTGRLYTIDPSSGFAVAVAAPLPMTLNGSDFGFDFNPTVDRLRVVSSGDQNFRLHPDTGALTADTPLSPAASVAIGGAAYSKNRAGATTSTLYAIDGQTDSLVRIGGVDGLPSPNGGIVTTIGPIGIDVQNMTGFDIASADNTAYASITTGGLSRLHVIDLATGNGVPWGFPGDGTPLRALAASTPGQVEFAAPMTLNIEGGTAFVFLRRTGSLLGPLTVDVVMSAPGDTAAAGSDYIAFRRQVTFYNGTELMPVEIQLIDDVVDESDETFTLTLANPGLGARLGARATTTVVITDNEGLSAAPTVTITSPTSDPSFPANTPFITLAGTAADDTGIASVTWFTSAGASGTATGTTSWTATNIPIASGEGTTIYVRAIDTQGNSTTDNLFVPTPDGFVYTLAEGATGGFFDLDLLMTNPNETAASVTVDFLKEDGTTITQLRVLPPLSRTTIRVDDIQGLEFGAVSTIVTSNDNLPLAVERTMSWDASGYGAHGEHATAGPALKWYFAEGSQGFFDTFLLLTNPGGGANTANVSFLLENGATVNASFPMLGSSRLSVPLKTIGGLASQSFGIVVDFTSPGVAERAMYFGSPLYNGGHASAGDTELSTEWFLAEGASSSFFTTFILLANPGGADANVTVTYLPEGGAPVVKEKTLPAGKRMTINAGFEAPSLNFATFATRVQSSAPIVVERAQYWPGGPDQWYEAHNSFGITALGTHWSLAEGRIGGASGAQTFILLANPGDTDANVTVRFLREPGRSPQAVTRTVLVKAGSRLTLGPSEQAPDLDDETFGATIESSHPIAVERALYWTANGQFWAAGTNATATRLP